MFERIRSEYLYARGLARALSVTGAVARARTTTLGDYFERWAGAYGDRIALESEAVSLSYAALNARANRIARWARAQGWGKGDAVAIFMRNGPDYVAIWAGLTRAGLVAALLNTNLTGKSLAHCVTVAKCRGAIVDAALAEAWRSAEPWLEPSVTTFGLGGDFHGARPLGPEIDGLPGEALGPAERASLTLDDPALYIYTSGTTGLPKAARITHSRALRIMSGFAAVTRAGREDRVYLALPMYHTNGGLIGPGIAFWAGGTVFIREKFSAHHFWREAAEKRCTIFVYVGELCRYLMNAPPGPADRAHPIRLCVGNGLRPDIFSRFKDRFGIRDVIEFYAATEGNVALFNFDSYPGAVGRIPGWAARRFPIRIVGHDLDTGRERRDARGRCVACGPDEVGEMIGEIVDDPSKPAARFDGYADGRATAAKIIRDVFRPGDAWFRTGDLMKRDARGYYYFVDRIGDTFRWKGENVSTTEVAETLSRFDGVHEAIVYGVAVPNTDGRAGMAAVVVDDMRTFDLDGFRAHVAGALPAYARRSSK